MPSLSGKSIVFSGTLSIKRAEATAAAKAAGATVTTAVSGNTDVLVVGPDAVGTEKTLAAQVKGTEVWTEEQFNAALSSGGASSSSPSEQTRIAEQADGNPSGVAFRTSKEGAPLHDIPNGTELPLVEEDGEWCRVRYAGKTGWVKTRNLRPAPCARVAQQADGNPSGVAFRKSKDAAPHVDLSNGTVLTLLREEGEWSHVMLANTVVGWVKSRNLVVPRDGPSAPSAKKAKKGAGHVALVQLRKAIRQVTAKPSACLPGELWIKNDCHKWVTFAGQPVPEDHELNTAQVMLTTGDPIFSVVRYRLADLDDVHLALAKAWIQFNEDEDEEDDENQRTLEIETLNDWKTGFFDVDHASEEILNIFYPPDTGGGQFNCTTYSLYSDGNFGLATVISADWVYIYSGSWG
ncbi:hypothetical protein AB1Y20_016326 [Prymnesium parvum]|uniref:BRCT domain-containing protein n=1 Tax=Prymnesium parvum TaxID=97485 RepID=A0AB34IFW0_PRYPA